MKITEHLVGPPSANEPDDVGVYVCKQEGVGARCAQTPGRNIGFKEAEGGAQDFNTGADFLCDSRSSDWLFLKVWTVGCPGKRGTWRGTIFAEICDPTDNCTNWTE